VDDTSTTSKAGTGSGDSSYYTSLGVSSFKDDVHDVASLLPSSILDSGFCRVVDDVFSLDPRFCVVSHADGAGSKSTLAYMKFRLSGDPDVFRGIAQDAIVMNIDDMICVGATDAFAISFVVNRNTRRIGQEVLRALVEGAIDFSQRMESFGIRIRLCGGETADVPDMVSTLVVDAVATSRMLRNQLVNNEITAGQAIVGLASGGKPASYEQGWSSGIGSNGLTVARHGLLSEEAFLRFPETVDPALSPELRFSGPFLPQDALPGTDLTVLDAMLSPTRTYAPLIKALLDEERGHISGLIHVTGGGHTKCTRFGHGIRFVKDLGETYPPVFEAIKSSLGLGLADMAKVFNLGYRMEIYCDVHRIDQIAAVAADFNIESTLIGHTEDERNHTSNTLHISGQGESFEFRTHQT
jgi:phosphoribosylformylglycinamidine cyclo-ligase